MKNFIKLFSFLFLIIILSSQNAFTEEKKKLLNPGWSFKGYFGKFDRASLQRG